MMKKEGTKREGWEAGFDPIPSIYNPGTATGCYDVTYAAKNYQCY